MDLQSRKQHLLNYILQHFTEYDFERLLNYDEDRRVGFNNYQQFVNRQRQILDQFNEGSVNSLEFLRNLIPMIDIIDKEDMIPWESSGFIFGNNGRIIIFHER